MLEQQIDAKPGSEMPTQFGGEPEQRVGAKRLAIGSGRAHVAVVEAGAEIQVQGQAVGVGQHVLAERNRPGQSRIDLIGRAGGVEIAAQKRPRPGDPGQPVPQEVAPILRKRRGEQQLGADIRAGLSSAGKPDIVFQNAGADFVDERPGLPARR